MAEELSDNIVMFFTHTSRDNRSPYKLVRALVDEGHVPSRDDVNRSYFRIGLLGLRVYGEANKGRSI